MAMDTCDTCQMEYDFTPENAIVNVFLESHACNHIEAKCPNGHSARFFVISQALLWARHEYKLHVFLFIEATPELLERAQRSWSAMKGKSEIEPSRQILRELYDQLRDFEQTN